MNRAISYSRAALTLVVMTSGAVVLLVVAVLTLFRLPRLYREGIVATLGDLTLAIWKIRVAVHQDRPFPEAQTIYISNHTSTMSPAFTVPLSNSSASGSSR